MNINYPDNQHKMTEGQTLIYLVNRRNYFKDREKKTYVELVDKNKNTKFVETHSHEFERYLNNKFIQKIGDIPSKRNIRSAMDFAAHKAEESGTLVEVGLRFAGYENVIFIDMANEKGEVIQVTADGWTIFPSSSVSVKFKRLPTQLPLAQPDRNGDIRLILKYINLPPGPEQMLYLAALSLLPATHINRPIICNVGPAGSSKTTVAKMSRAVWDPFTGTSNNCRWTADDLAITFASNAVPLFDNVGKFKDHISDVLCAAVTGGDLIKRTQYTNDGQFHLSYQRPIILTALNMPSTKSDFLDRCLSFNYEPISKYKRLDLQDIMAGFQQDLPKILGGCLNTLSAALRLLPSIKLPFKPRLSDFTKYGTAVASVLGYNQETFLEALMNNIEGNKQNLLLAEQPLASVLIEYYHQLGEYNGPTKDLWSVIAQQCPYPSGGGKGWPNSVTGFGKMARNSELIGILCEIGLKIEFRTIQGKSHVKFYREEMEMITTISEEAPEPATETTPDPWPKWNSEKTTGESDHPTAEVEPPQNPQQQLDNPFRNPKDKDNNGEA